MKRKEPHVFHINKVEPPNDGKKEKIPEKMNSQWFPGFPTTTVIVGQPGSGKTNLVIYMLTSPHFYQGFFDKVYFFGLTCKSDPLYKAIQLPEEQIITTTSDFLPRLTELLAEQQRACESNWKEAPKVLFLFEDLTSLFRRVQHHEDFIRCYTQIRHLKGSSIAMVHKYKAFERTCRMSSLHIILFKANKTEVKQLYEDVAVADLSYPQFEKVAHFCMTPRTKDDHPFFYVNLMADEKKRFRRCFTEIVNFKKTSYNNKELE